MEKQFTQRYLGLSVASSDQPLFTFYVCSWLGISNFLSAVRVIWTLIDLLGAFLVGFVQVTATSYSNTKIENFTTGEKKTLTRIMWKYDHVKYLAFKQKKQNKKYLTTNQIGKEHILSGP